MSPLIQPQLLYVCQRMTFIKVSAWHLSTYLIKYELSQKKCFIFFPGTKKNVCFKVGAKKKNCVLIFQKKNITESNNLGPPPPQKSNGASLINSENSIDYILRTNVEIHSAISDCHSQRDTGDTSETLRLHGSNCHLRGVICRPKPYISSIYITIRQSTLPKTWNRSQCCPPVLGVGTNAFTIYQVWFYHITTSNYDIDPIKSIHTLHHQNQKNRYWRRFTSIFYPIICWLVINTF